MTLNGENSGSPRILQYFLDTRPLWPVHPQSNKKDEVQQLKIVVDIPYHELSYRYYLLMNLGISRTGSSHARRTSQRSQILPPQRCQAIVSISPAQALHHHETLLDPLVGI